MRAYGLEVGASLPLPGFAPAANEVEPDVHVRLAHAAEIEQLWTGAQPGASWTTVLSDGSRLRAQRGRDGARRFVHGTGTGASTFFVDPEVRTLLCAPVREDDAGWQRVMLDTVLTTASVLRGFEALHAGAVEIDGRVLALAGDSGGGKTTLAAELMSREATFFTDDILVLDRLGDALGAHPGPPVINAPLAIDATARGRIGTTLATFDHEAWLLVDRPAGGPCPLGAICLVDRRPGQALELERLAPTPVSLLPHALGFGLPPERLATRFELLADLSAAIPVHRLHADPAVPPAQLADLVEERLREPVAMVAP